jgi:alpha-L-fucosidase
LKVNGDAIYGTTAAPFAQQPAWGRITRKARGKGTILYLHVFDWPKDGKLTVAGLAGKITRATLLAGSKKVAVAASDAGVTVTLPPEAPDPISSTVVLETSGPLQVR